MSEEKIEKPKSAEEIPAPSPPEEPPKEDAEKPAQTEEAPPEKAQPEETAQESVEETKEKPPEEEPAGEKPKIEEHVEEIAEPKEETKEEPQEKPAPEAEHAEDESKGVSEEPTAVGEEEAGKDREGEIEGSSIPDGEAETDEEREEITENIKGRDELPSLFMSSEMVVEESNVSLSTDDENLSTKHIPKIEAALGSTIDLRKSIQGSVDRRMVKYANTYQLDSNKPFRVEQVNKILKSVMEEALNNLIYDPEKCIRMTKWASTTIRTKTKQMELDRYKIISYVSIGEKKSQDMLITCRSLWDIDRDKFCSYSMENNNVYGIALCFGLYYE